MTRFWRWVRAVPLAILLGIAAGPLCPISQAQQTTSWWDSFTDKLTHPFGPPKPAAPVPGAEDGAISLKTQGKAGPATHVAIAQWYEQQKKTAEAETEYQTALKEMPDFLPALLGYAHLQDQLGKSKEAIELYQHAIRAHPEQAAAHNNLGLCYARQNRLDDAVAAMSRAIQLDGKNPLYRNNIAAVLVDQGRISEALPHLRAAHDDAATYYNLGYLLQKKGQSQVALQYFRLALQADPSMEAARRWVLYLQHTIAQARVATNPIAAGVRVITPPPQEAAEPTPPEEPPRRLPTVARQPAADDSAPGVAYGSSAPPTAPLPPSLSNPALRPLPRAE